MEISAFAEKKTKIGQPLSKCTKKRYFTVLKVYWEDVGKRIDCYGKKQHNIVE